MSNTEFECLLLKGFLEAVGILITFTAILVASRVVRMRRPYLQDNQRLAAQSTRDLEQDENETGKSSVDGRPISAIARRTVGSSTSQPIPSSPQPLHTSVVPVNDERNLRMQPVILLSRIDELPVGENWASAGAMIQPMILLTRCDQTNENDSQLRRSSRPRSNPIRYKDSAWV